MQRGDASVVCSEQDGGRAEGRESRPPREPREATGGASTHAEPRSGDTPSEGQHIR